LAVTEIIEGESFKVEVKNPLAERIYFDWFIVGEKDETLPEAPPAPPIPPTSEIPVVTVPEAPVAPAPDTVAPAPVDTILPITDAATPAMP